MTFWGKSGSRLTSRRLTALLAICTATVALSSCGNEASGKGAQAGFVKGKDGVDTVPVADRKPAPDISGKTLTGKKLSIDDFKGKVVVLNIWGSWCGPCIAEAPNFAKVAKESKKKGVQFIGINTRDSSTAQAISFEEQHKIPYPSLFDPTGKLMLRFPKGSLNPQFLPSTVAIDRQGRTAARSIGPLGEAELRKMIEHLIAEKWDAMSCVGHAGALTALAHRCSVTSPVRSGPADGPPGCAGAQACCGRRWTARGNDRGRESVRLTPALWCRHPPSSVRDRC